MDDRVLENHVTKWIKSTQVINKEADRLEEDERKAYHIVLATFEKKRPNLDAIATNSEILKGYLEGGVKDDLYTAVRDFVKISNPIAIENFEAFKDFLDDKDFFSTRANATAGYTGSSMGTAEYRRQVIDGNVCEGMFLGNDRVWKGKISYANGNVYEGEWNNQGPYGEGIYTLKSGQKRIGRFFDNGKGKGKIEYPDGFYYEGEWNLSGRHGFGKTIINDIICEGEYLNDDRVGKGKFIWPNGDWYEGGWNNIGANGFGSWRIGNRTDTGQYKDNNRIGNGRMDWDDGDWYDGEWNEQGANGFGIWRIGNRTDKGQFKDGKRFGTGRMEWDDGDWYEGQWNENGQHGHGVQFIKKYNRTDDGDWNNGHEAGYTLMKWNNGDRYKGTWSRNSAGQLNGVGKYFTKNGNKVRSGEYVNGEWKNDWFTTRNTISSVLWIIALCTCLAGSWLWGIGIGVVAWFTYEGK